MSGYLGLGKMDHAHYDVSPSFPSLLFPPTHPPTHQPPAHSSSFEPPRSPLSTHLPYTIGMSGYLGLGKMDHAHYYVSLVPSLVFSLVSIVIGATIKR